MNAQSQTEHLPAVGRALTGFVGHTLSDGQLLERFVVAGDEAALELLVRRHSGMVLGVCRRVVGHVSDAEDAFQATFLVLIEKASTLRDRDRVGGWLHGVAHRTALAARTRLLRRRSREQQVERMNEPSEEANDPIDWLPILDEELAKLSDKFRLPIVLCDLEGRPRKEVASHLGIPEGTLSSRLNTGRKRLCDRLTKRGVSLSVGTMMSVLAREAAASVACPLLATTVQMCFAVARDSSASVAAVSPPVAALTRGVLKTMFLSKLKITTAVALVAGMLSFGVGVLAQEDPYKPSPAPKAKPQYGQNPYGQPYRGGDSGLPVKPGQYAPGLYRAFGSERPEPKPMPKANKRIDDETFLRRVKIDLTGIPPTDLEIWLFVNDKNQTKRAKLLDFFLKNPKGKKALLKYMERKASGAGGNKDEVEMRDLINKLSTKKNRTREEENSLFLLKKLLQDKESSRYDRARKAYFEALGIGSRESEYDRALFRYYQGFVR